MWAWHSEVMQSRGRPEQTWDAVVKKDMKKRGLIEEWTQDREVERSDPYPYPCLNKDIGEDSSNSSRSKVCNIS